MLLGLRPRRGPCGLRRNGRRDGQNAPGDQGAPCDPRRAVVSWIYRSYAAEVGPEFRARARRARATAGARDRMTTKRTQLERPRKTIISVETLVLFAELEAVPMSGRQG